MVALAKLVRTTSRQPATFLGAVCGLVLAGCVDSSREPEPPPTTPPSADTGQQQQEAEEEEEEFTTEGMLANLVDAVIVPNYEALAQQTADFAAADSPLATYCEAIGGDSEDADLATARNSWRETMAAVQATEMHVFGPVADNGEALRKRILSYSDATLSTCGVDLSVVLADEGEDFDIQTRSLNQRGYGAIEYLLFNDDLTHTCAPQVPDTADWNDLGETERRTKRCELARLVADDAADAAATTAERWRTDGGDYRAEFLDPEATGDALQLLTDGIFAMDLLVKDRKLGIPTGIHDDCSTAACPDLVESPYAANSFANIRANAAAFKTLFEGGDGFGFDDFIVNEEFADVAERFSTNTQALIDYVAEIETSLYDQVLDIESADRGTECLNAFAAADLQAELSACTAVGLVKRVTDDLKIDFVTIVGVTIPGGAQTDND